METALLLRPPPSSQEWASTFKLDLPERGKQQLQVHINDTRVGTGIFTATALQAAHSQAMSVGFASGVEWTCSSQFLRSLLQDPFLHLSQPTNVDVSNFFFPWGSQVLGFVLHRYRVLQSSDRQLQGKRRATSKLQFLSNETLASEVYNAFFGGNAESTTDVRASSAASFPGDGSGDDSGNEASHDDYYGADGSAEHQLTQSALIDAFTANDHGSSSNHIGGYTASDKMSSAPAVTAFAPAFHEAQSNADTAARSAPVTVAVISVEPSSAHMLSYHDYLRQCQRHGSCLHILRNGSEECTALFALPPYDRVSLEVTHGPPERVDYIRLGSAIQVTCTCPAARLAASAQASENLKDIPGIIDGTCWHRFCLSQPDLVQLLMDKCDVPCDATGVPSVDFVKIIGTKKAAIKHAGYAETSGPSRLYVAVHSNQGLGGPGNLRLAIVTLSLCERKLRISCDACGNASKVQMGASRKAICRHFSLIETKSKNPSNKDERQLETFLLSAASLEPLQRSPVFDTIKNLWAFPSLELENLAAYEQRARVALQPPLFPFGSFQCNSSNFCKPHGPRASMGGPGDPKTMRYHTLIDIANGVPSDRALLANGVVSQYCTCESAHTKLAVVQKGLIGGKCHSCSYELEHADMYSTCSCCGLLYCSSCALHRPINDDGLLLSAFPEISYQLQPLLSTIATAVATIAAGPSDSRLHLKPLIPPPREGCACIYSETGYTARHESTVYGFSYTTRAVVYSLECCQGHVECSLPFLGQEQNMHCQTTESIYRVDLFEYFWFLLRHMKGAGSASFVQFVQLIYNHNGAGSFVSEPSFRAALFGYFSTLKINFNKPCITCPVYKCSETGILFSGCQNVQIDAVHLRSKISLDEAGQLSFDEPVPQSPVVDCFKEHIYDRLFIPGSRTMSAVGRLRVRLQACCKKVLEGPFACSTPGVKENFASLPHELESHESVKYIASVSRLVLDSFGQAVTCLQQNVATMLLRMCDDHAGEILQIINEPEIRFLHDALQRSTQGTLSTVYLKMRSTLGVRKSLVDLVVSALVTEAPSKVVIATPVFDFLTGVHRTAKAEFKRAGQNRLETAIIPPASRVLNDPSKTGIAVNFTQGGQQLRYAPRFIHEPSDRDKKSGQCRKPQHFATRHQKFLTKTKGLFNVTCLDSTQAMSQLIMRKCEGRSLGNMLFFLFLPHFPRNVSSDIGCQAASWAHARLRYFFRRWRWHVDQFHISPHKCRLITDPREFSYMRDKNDSLVEQLHSAQRALGMTMQSSSSKRAMFLVQLINYDIYCKVANDAKISEEKRSWPADAPVYADEDFTATSAAAETMDVSLEASVALENSLHVRGGVKASAGNDASRNGSLSSDEDDESIEGSDLDNDQDSDDDVNESSGEEEYEESFEDFDKEIGLS